MYVLIWRLPSGEQPCCFLLKQLLSAFARVVKKAQLTIIASGLQPDDNVACLFGCLLAWTLVLDQWGLLWQHHTLPSSGPGTCCAVGPTPFCRKVLPWRWSQLDMAPGGQLLTDTPASSFFQPMCYHMLPQFTNSIFGTMKIVFHVDVRFEGELML